MLLLTLGKIEYRDIKVRIMQISMIMDAIEPPVFRYIVDRQHVIYNAMDNGNTK